MARLRLQGQPGAMACAVTDVPAFPGERFTLGYPEAVGDVAGPYWFGSIKPTWEERDDGVWISKGEQPGQVSYVMTLTPSEDAVTAHFRLTNHSATTWTHGMAFNCVQCAAASSLRDHDCLRHWVRAGGQFRRLAESAESVRSAPGNPALQRGRRAPREGASLCGQFPRHARCRACPLDGDRLARREAALGHRVAAWAVPVPEPRVLVHPQWRRIRRT